MSIDVGRVKEGVDIVRVAEGYTSLRRSGRAWVGRCPLPGHEDGSPSFTVYHDTQSWYCFGCQQTGDVIELVMQVEGVDFKGAVARLGGEPMPGPRLVNPPKKRAPEPRREEDGAPAEAWQAKAWQVIAQAEGLLWGPGGERALAYLNRTRGLSHGIIKLARLGYVPGGPTEWVDWHGLHVPCGILIPWVTACGGRESDFSTVWALKVRRAAGKPKYQQVKGGSAGGLYWIDRVGPGKTVLIVEGEFDALVVAQAGEAVVPVALGSASNTIRPRWMGRLVLAEGVYARMDKDQAGETALAKLQQGSSRIKGVQVPDPHKDLNDYYLEEPEAFEQWIGALMKF